MKKLDLFFAVFAVCMLMCCVATMVPVGGWYTDKSASDCNQQQCCFHQNQESKVHKRTFPGCRGDL